MEYILLAYLSFCVLYAFIFSIAGNFYKNRSGATSKPNKIAVLIPAYKEDSVIISVAKEALRQNYPKEHFDVTVIGDKLKDSTISQLKELPIRFFEVFFEKSTKTRALNYFLKNNTVDYAIAVVLDADNIMEPDFLEKSNRKFNEGYKAIQTRRVAKNMNTSIAILDALSEIINNHILRKGHHTLGLSCSLIGSGMVFDYDLFKNTLLKMDAIGGFDRELEYRLLEQGHKVVYLEEAIVYDEKVDKAENFSNQRKRWISSQFNYLKKYFVKGFLQLFKGKVSYFNSAVLRNLVLPRVIVLGLLFIITIFTVSFYQLFEITWKVWGLLFLINLLTLIIAVPVSFYNKNFFKSLFYVPQTFWIMFLLLFKLKGANKSFIHTPHGEIGIDHQLPIKESEK